MTPPHGRTVNEDGQTHARPVPECAIEPEDEPGVWSGVLDDDPWRMEVESDCVGEEEFTVSVWVSNGQWRPVNGAFLSAEQAREVAEKLLAAADETDKSNQRVAAWRTENEA